MQDEPRCDRNTNIFLIGPMGAGKSTLGRLLASALKRPFYDSDKVIEDRCGAGIPWIFDIEGEEGFRIRETQVIEELTQEQGIVLATGGGAVLKPENRNALHQRGFVIFLRTTVEQQLARTNKDRNRPLLQTENPRQRLELMREIRDPLYLETAHLVIDTDQRPPRQVMLDIKKKLLNLL
ncbi:shikimate kinase AroK [Marinospirillum alkaliphilum]|uniref:Shikimate kinase n=1 Tax=Marinospirillum alkaliphilum DSM 21637 TaxID=1122209 RepID=A0A1K1W5D9_9GAMM|nr:shikimate kinase AroK [Marinospirillum alkaliphilum]SFX32391.1 shikimate kinase [Marinospirillum alkaliphilum DSM 21637]